jgi:hypothetical protein
MALFQTRTWLLRCVAFVLAWYCAWRRLLKQSQRRWWGGLGVTVNAVARAAVERWIGRRDRGIGGNTPPRQAIEVEGAPFIGDVQTVSEIIEHPDGEVYGVWWSAPLSADSGTAASERVWVILPGGMSSGNAWYVHNAARSGVFGSDRWCVFHQPGIVTGCRVLPTPGITDLKYLSHFLREVLPPRRLMPTIMGYSAGSMLAIRAAQSFEAAEDRSLLSCVVAIHGPDKLRYAFEALKANPFRLDIYLAQGIYNILVRSRCTEFLPVDRGGGIQHTPWCWTEGWPWMVHHAEQMRGREWMEMEDSLYSCELEMQKPLGIPTMRILALDDPIISYEDCVDPALFDALDEVVIQPSGGHCAPFRADPGLACRVRDWACRHETHDKQHDL